MRRLSRLVRLLVPACAAGLFLTGAVAAVPTGAAAATPTCTGEQYLGEYFTGTDTTGTPATARCDDAIDNDWGTGGPTGTGVGPDQFSVRWTRTASFAAATYSLVSTADDGMVVQIDGRTVLDNGGSHGARTRSTEVALTAATHTVVVRYTELTGAAVAGFSLTPAAAPTCPVDQYTVDYFANTTLSGTPVATRCSNDVDEQFGTAGPGVPGVGADRFSIRWTGSRVFSSGNHVFTATADDGMTVSLDGTQVVDNGGNHPLVTKTATRAVTAGSHKIQVAYFDNTGSATARFSVTGTSPQAVAAPTGLTAKAASGSVALSWTAVAGATGYQVYRSSTGVPTAGGVPVNSAPLTGPAYTDTAVVNGTAYTYVVTAIGSSGTASTASNPAAASPNDPDGLHLKVDFADEASSAATGYVRDFGQPYGVRTSSGQGSGNIYGWVRPGTSTPYSLVGNGRNRNVAGKPPVQSDPRLATFLHMQLAIPGGSGSTMAGSWELAVPDGAYAVTAWVGDAGAWYDSSDWLNIEDQNAVAAFTPSTATRFASATRTVVVTDGRLTVSALGGSNTKIDWLSVDSVPGATVREPAGTTSRPFVIGKPANMASGISTREALVEDLDLPGGAIDEATLATGNAGLTKVADGTTVPVKLKTSGGGDTINIAPTSPLAPGAPYRLFVTDKVTDIQGRAFLPYSVVFTTGGRDGGTGGPIGFDKAASGAPAQFYTAMTKGPDGRMYAATIDGHIYRMDIARDGRLSAPFDITTVRDHAVSAGLFGAPDRTIVGLAFDPASTAANPVLWVTDNAEFVGVFNIPDFSSHLAKLTGPDLGTYTDVLTNLPRSVKDHQVNSIRFGPDGGLYFTVGALTGMGGADKVWGSREEHLLSAAVLRLDTTRLPTKLPLDVRTVDAGGPYDPFTAGAPLTVYASGVRNAYDLVWHSNGHLYAPTNGSAAGGNTPGTPSVLPPECAGRRIDGKAYTGPAVPELLNVAQSQTDYVYDVRRGRYYGHPNPSRCEWVLDNGNPTGNPDPYQIDRYPVGVTADPAYDLSAVTDAGVHASADGAVEYRGNAFGGALDGKLLVVRYSSGQDIETFDVGEDAKLSNRTVGITGLTGFDQPLALTEDTATGNLYVSETGSNRITLLRPQTGAGPPTAKVSDRLVFTDVAGGAPSATRTATITNVGASPLVVGGLSVVADSGDPVNGDHADSFAVVSPPALPATVAPGASLSVGVRFGPTAAGPQGAVLRVATNDPTAGSSPVVLRGLGTRGLGGASEPSLQWILDTLQVPVRTGTADPSSNAMPSTAAAIGDEIVAPAFAKAETDTPVTVTPLAVFGPQGPAADPDVVHVGAYDAASTGTALQGVLDVPNAGYQSLEPAATRVQDFDPVDPFGLSWAWPALGHTTYQRDDLNTWEPVAAARHKVRVYPFRSPTGSTVPNSYVVAPEDVAAPGVDFQDAAVLVRNVVPVSGANRAVLSVANLDVQPAPDRVVFSRIQKPRTDKLPDHPQLVHDTATVRVSNTGTDPMKLTGLPVTGPWTAVPASPLPATVAPGASVDVRLTFTATSGDLRTGTLTVQTDAGAGATKVVQLAGFWQSQSENDQEPTVAEMVKLLGWTTDVPTDLNQHGSVVASGDEVLSPFWKRVDTSKPVAVTQLAAYHGWNNGAAFQLVNSSGGQLAAFGINPDSAQSVLPWAEKSTSVIAGRTFTPSVATFGFKVDSESSDDTRNDATPDKLGGCTGACGHHIRFWPVRDSAGALVPGSYLLGMDYSGINYDYQDNLYLITNIAPTPRPATP